MNFLSENEFESLCPPDKSCFFTGHRHIHGSDAAWLSVKLAEAVISAANAGITAFIAGGACGFDTLAAETVLKLREDKRLPETVKLMLALPCPPAAQSLKFSLSDKVRYETVLKKADGAVVLSDKFTCTCMHERNEFMADRARYGIAFLRPGGKKSGTSHTVEYAKKKNRLLTFLIDDVYAVLLSELIVQKPGRTYSINRKSEN